MNRFFFGPLPFDDVSGYIEAATTLASWIREAGSTPVIYGIRAMKAEEEVQSIMNHVNRKLVGDLDALYAPVGETWWSYKSSWPDIEMYDEHHGRVSGYGQHADGEYGDVCGWVPGEAGCGYVLWEFVGVGVTLKKF